ncbi:MULTISPECIES: NADPH-dependent FMN reductase [Streptomyces]|uniref:NAD(P)H-dependent oxidoreductase n=1 Tax=Streptomyces phaeolivaceus TaxID=2653200 RepID=A0A5P8JY58_9ACTN|nr:NAD(P)H-dependent oxidoreductase [Streptomyces phaeolivaceus]QFQ95640.1 NAD(P)H-dependent oxidoreductase [Streptomyces phaeolivaceus]
MPTRILALVGSLRSGSHNRQLAEAAVTHAPVGVEVQIFEGLAELPFYNQDIDTPGNVPAADALRAAAGAADALLLCAPEYNGAMPALLKNAIDWLSRPYGQGAISGKPVGVIGAAHGQYGGVWAQDDARKVAGIAGGAVVEGIKLAVPFSGDRFDATHAAKDQEIAESMPRILTALADVCLTDA